MEKNSSRQYFFAAGWMAALTAAFVVVLKKYDVRAVGPKGTKIGMASLNSAVAKLLPFNEKWYKITDLLGFAAIAAGLVFAVVGLIQLIKGKGLKGVDSSILLLGGLYVVLGILYLFFNKFAVNYRPIILDDGLEASFPSSHTMLVCTIMGSAIVELRYLIESDGLRALLDTVAWVMIFVMIFGRIISGAHWITDIVSGIMFSLTLVFLYHGLVLAQEKE